MSCKHDHVTITVDFVIHAKLTSLAGETASESMTHVAGPTYGASGAIQGWWSKAYLHTVCHECGRTDEFSTASYRGWPQWLKAHWAALVATGGLPLEIYRRYMLREEPR